MKTKKNLIFYVVLLLVFTTIGIISSNINFNDYHRKISSWLSVPNKSFIESNDIKIIKIKFNKEDNQHFKRLFKDYIPELDPSKENANSKFLSYYSENNNWKKNTLTINGDSFDVKIKSHGRTPFEHKFGKYFSLSIKFKSKPFPFFSKRVNFVIYNRIQLSSEILKLLSSKFNLYSPKFELVSASVGKSGDYYYFIEERINEDFFIARNLPMVIFNDNIDGSLIYNGNIKTTELSKRLIKELKDRDDLSSELKFQIKNDYLNFNESILKKNMNSLKQFFDMDYMSRLNAFRTVYGSDGHGFASTNIEMAYDTVSRLFYPINHRDMISTTLINCKYPYEFMDSKREKIPFWILLDSDSVFREKTSQQVKIFLSNNNKSSVKKELDSIHEFYKSAYNYEFSYINNVFDGKSIIENIECLEKIYN